MVMIVSLCLSCRLELSSSAASSISEHLEGGIAVGCLTGAVNVLVSTRLRYSRRGSCKTCGGL